MVKVARGKALVAKLRADPKVRDAEALAAELGRKKQLRHAAKKVKKVVKKAAKKNKSGSDIEGVTREEAKRVSPGFPQAQKLADTIPLGAGMHVQRSSKGAADRGKVLGVKRDGRIVVKTDDGEIYAAPRSSLTVLLTDESRRIGNKLAQKEALERFKNRNKKK